MQNQKAKTQPSPLPQGLPPWITAELIQETIEVWQPYYEKTLTPKDAAAIIRNVAILLG